MDKWLNSDLSGFWEIFFRIKKSGVKGKNDLPSNSVWILYFEAVQCRHSDTFKKIEKLILEKLTPTFSFKEKYAKMSNPALYILFIFLFLKMHFIYFR